MALGDDEMLTTEGIQRMCQIVLNETIMSYNSILAHITHITSQGQDILKTGILYSNRTPEPHTIPVRLFKPRTRETIPDDYDTRRWVRDAVREDVQTYSWAGDVIIWSVCRRRLGNILLPVPAT